MKSLATTTIFEKNLPEEIEVTKKPPKPEEILLNKTLQTTHEQTDPNQTCTEMSDAPSQMTSSSEFLTRNFDFGKNSVSNLMARSQRLAKFVGQDLREKLPEGNLDQLSGYEKKVFEYYSC